MALTKATQNVLEGIVSTGSTGVSAGSFVVAQQYKITALGTTTQTQWNTIAGTTGQTYVVGSLFTAATTGASSGTGAAAVARTLANRFADVVNVKDFGAVGDGVADDTIAIQAAIDAAKTNSKILHVTSGTYLISGLVIYPASYLTFDPNATLKLSGDGIAIRTVQSIGATAPTTGFIDGIILENPTIDMNNKNGCGILLECARDSLVTSAYVYNIGTGTISRNDTYSTDTYPTMGIGIKGITNIGTAVFNRIVLARCMSVDTGVTPTGGVGIWLGGSQSGTSQRANVNRIEQPICKELLYGIHVDFGSDNIISQPEVSTCDNGVRVGRITGGAASSFRNRIVSPYIEETTTGVYLNFRSQTTFIDGLGSTSGSVNAIYDGGTNTSVFSPNIDYEPNFACFNKEKVLAEIASVKSVLFPAIQVPNASATSLDDYKEGTFVPSITCLGTAPTSVIYATRLATYTKIGRLVVVQISLDWNSMAGSPAGQLAITDLPYIPDSAAVAAIFPQSGVGSPAGGAYVTGLALTDGYIRLYKFDGTTNVAWENDTAAFIRCTLSYITTT
jgi:hypothetical protein